MVLFYILASVFIISLISLVGLFTISIKKDILNRFLLILIAFAAGTLLGTAFLHMLPEAVHEVDNAFMLVLAGIVFFMLAEKFIHWHHCLTHECHIHSYAYINLIADGLHNFIDGVIIAASFMVSIPLGITSAFAIALHEIPQEIGDFAVLLHAGLSRGKALLYNFISALTAVLGALLTFFFAPLIEGSIPMLIAFAAGGFIYIAAADLIPELHKEREMKKMILQSIAMLLGIAIIYFAIGTSGHAH
ncbi:MAG: ZIP family metal transporter [Candidatus Diapherotrites archaeon]